MAEPGDPHPPEDDAEAAPAVEPTPHDLDDQVGFASPAALQGQARVEPEPEPEPELPLEPVADVAPEPEPDPAFPAGEEARLPEAPAPMPEWARETRSHDRAPPQPDGAMGLYTVYALILFAVPTLGVSALIGLLAVTGRELPADPVARSHFIYQQRTLWAAAVAALLGAILIVVSLGVFVLFLLAVWLMLRGALGVLRLKSGQAIRDPRHWLI